MYTKTPVPAMAACVLCSPVQHLVSGLAMRNSPGYRALCRVGVRVRVRVLLRVGVRVRFRVRVRVRVRVGVGVGVRA